MAPATSCPKCESALTRYLESMSTTSTSFYRCAECGALWYLPKAEEVVAKPAIDDRLKTKDRLV